MAKDFPMAYIVDVSAKELKSKIASGTKIKLIAQTFPHQIFKFGKQQELMSIWGLLELSSEEWLHNNHWDCETEIDISTAGDAGKKNLGAAVASGKVRRIRVFKIRHAGSKPTIVTIKEGTNTKDSIDVPPQTTRVYADIHGIKFTETQQPTIESSDLTDGHTYVRASGVEA